MSFKTSINITGAAPNPAEFERALSDQNVNPIVGAGVVALLKEHFLALNDERHGRFPGNVTGFYATAADATYYTNEGGEPEVVVAEPLGLRQRLLGGTIAPKDKDYIAVPNYDYLDVTHGKSPTEFDNLTVLFGYQETGAIGPIGLISKQGGVRYKDTYTEDENFQTEGFGKYKRGKQVKTQKRDERGRREGIEEGEVLYWLKLFVIQEPDPSVIPTNEELEQAGYEAAAEYLGRGFTTGFIPANTPE